MRGVIEGSGSLWKHDLSETRSLWVIPWPPGDDNTMRESSPFVSLPRGAELISR